METITTPTQETRAFLRTIVRGCYQLQKLRIQTGNRLVATFKAKLGQAPSEAEDGMDAEGKEMLEVLRLSYDRITDGIAEGRSLSTAQFEKRAAADRKKPNGGLIDKYTELTLVRQYMDLLKSEQSQFAQLKNVLADFPIWTEFLQGVKGIGPAMAGVIISEIDISKAEYPSSLWAYAGLDVAPDGRGRSRRKEHLIEVEYTTSAGGKAKRNSITFNPWLKTKLIGVLAGGFIKLGDRSEYRLIYDQYKHRITNRPDIKKKMLAGDMSKGHVHNMAQRYMVKRFLVDLYKEWRALEGLPVAPEYSEAKLGMVHKKAA